MQHQIKKTVIDSCVFLKIFVEEHDSDKALKLFTEIVEKNYQIFVPSLFVYEILNLCSLKKLDTKNILSRIKKYEKSILTIVSPSTELLIEAAAMAKQGHEKSGYPSFYDCIYHAIAIKKECYFITSNIKHIKKSQKFGFIKDLSDLYKK